MDMIELMDLIKSKSREDLEKMFLFSILEITKLLSKLKKIENMFKSGTVDLEELRKIVLEEER